MSRQAIHSALNVSKCFKFRKSVSKKSIAEHHPLLFRIIDKFLKIRFRLMSNFKQSYHKDKVDNIQLYNATAQNYIATGGTLIFSISYTPFF